MFWNVAFWKFISPLLSQSVISEIHKLLGSFFFSKFSRFDANFRNERKSSEKSFCFLDNCTWIRFVKFYLLRREYLSSAVNFSKKRPKTSVIRKKYIFQLNFPQSHWKRWSKYCPPDFSSAWVTLACWLSKCFLKRGFLDICQTTFFAVWIFSITYTMRSIVFSKCWKFDIEKVFCFLDSCILIGRGIFSLLQREYLWLAVNV